MAAAIAVAVAVVVVACISYFVVRDQLRSQVDNALRAQANAIGHSAGLGAPFPGIPASVGGPAPYGEVVTRILATSQAVLGPGDPIPPARPTRRSQNEEDEQPPSPQSRPRRANRSGTITDIVCRTVERCSYKTPLGSPVVPLV